MDFYDYQEASRRTRNPEVTGWASSMEAALGISGEAGEIAELVKKSNFQGHELDPERVKEEVGDLLWYLAELADFIGFDLSDAAAANIEKLKKRYPDGFSAEASRKRNE